MQVKAALLLCVLALAAPMALSWGNTGHQMIASVASSLLQAECSNCVSTVQSIVGGSMESVATWADEVRAQSAWKWTAPLHYVDTPDWACTFNYDQDCAQDMCVVGALNNFTAQITGSGDWANYSTRFVIHFVGDVHQPLHVSFSSDRGGNSITGTFEGTSTNLHAVWDENIIEKRIKDNFSGSQTNYAAWILAQVQGPWSANATQWVKCPNGGTLCADSWASETGALACSNAYKDQNGDVVPNGFTLGDPYYNFNSGVVDQQLAKAAVRLASVINGVLDTEDVEALLSNVLTEMGFN